MEQKILPILKICMVMIVGIIFLFTIFTLGYWYGGKTQVAQGTFEEGWQAAVEKLEQSNLLPPEPDEIYSLSGTITQISENRVYFQAGQVVTNPLKEQAPTDRIAIITPKTQIVKLIAKNSADLAKEEEAYRKTLENLKPGEVPPNPPTPYTEKEVGVTELKTGDAITVTADKNIKFAIEFEAQKIVISTSAAPVPMP